MKTYRRNKRLAKADRNPCDCWNECGGYPTQQTGMKVTRYLWQGCTRTGGRGGENRHQIFLWKTHTRTGNLVNDKQNKSFMKWRHLFGIKPTLAAEPVASILDLGGTISSDGPAHSWIDDEPMSDQRYMDSGSGHSWL
tara:strand:+ start:710 stop:1123 length:414 start_codon:yes stop_codon:yes gene_type:complete